MAELSQAQIDALMQENAQAAPQREKDAQTPTLTREEMDAIGEIGNISMGSSATALSTLLNRKIRITTPVVQVVSTDELARDYPLPFVAVEIAYTDGMKGKNVLNIKTDDVKIMTDIMMGGGGDAQPGEITELHLSAMGELMNQMMGSAATALSQMINRRIDISPPRPLLVANSQKQIEQSFLGEKMIVRTTFTLSIEGKGDSQIMQLTPVSFARELVDMLKRQYLSPARDPAEQTAPQTRPQAAQAPQSQADRPEEVKIKYVQFRSFGEEKPASVSQQSRYDILMDIPLEVSVELGSVKKSISEILTFGAGTIIELNKLAGENVDIVINNRIIAKGEVIVIDEAYGVRITEVLK